MRSPSRHLAEEAMLEPLLARPPRVPSPEALQGEKGRALLAAASRHGLLPVLAERIAGAAAPPDLRRRLDRLLAGARVASAPMRAALDEALLGLARSGIRTAALKGPVLADRLWADPQARPSGDLDLLVAGADLDAAVASLERLGYRLERGWRERYQRRHHRHLSLARAGGPTVEVHFRAHSGFGTTLGSEELLARARGERTRGGAPVLVLAPEDELLQLCLHAADHLFERLGWLEDLLLLSERHAALDGAALAGRAAAAGCSRALAFALLRLRALGAAVPQEPLAALGPRRARAAEGLRRASLGARRRKASQALRMAYHAALADRAAAAAGYLGHEAHWYVRRRAYRYLPGLFHAG